MLNVDYISKVKDILESCNNIQNLYELQVKKLKKSGIFDSFYEEFLIFFELNFRELLLSFNNKKFNIEIDKVVLNCIISFRNDMIDLSKKILISELYKMKEKGQLIGKTKFERYEYFDNLLTGEKRLRIIEENPVLAYLIINKIHTKITHIKECLERFASDFKEIKEKFDIDIKVLNKILLDEGDTHNDGKSVIILELNDENKLVYKPHSMSSDESFSRLINYINSSTYLKYNLRAVNSINKDTYGWQEFIKYKECESEEQVKAYFYRMGALTAIFNVIRSKDFHYENLIANGEFPIPIDLETILSNRKAQLVNDEGSYSLAEAFAKEIDQSIYGTLMIPQNLEMIKFDVDMSGLNGGINSTEELEFIRILNMGTDEIGYERVKGGLDEKQNRVRLMGKLIELQDYVPDIVMGLDEGYEFFIEKKEELIKLIKNNQIFRGEYRQVLRATAKYVKFLDAAIHPVYTDKYENRTKVFSYLFGKSELDEETKGRVRSEIDQLYKNDVPYFWSEFNSRDLHGADGTCLSGYFEKTMCQLILERIRLADRKDKEKQICYMKASIASLVNIEDSYKYRQIYSSNALEKIRLEEKRDNKFIELATKIAEYLENICIWNSEKNKCSFMALNVQNDGTIKYGSLNRNLYEGSGVVLFLACLAKVTDNSKYIKMARGILSGYEEIYNKSEFQIKSNGAFTGMGSLLYIYYNLWRILGDKTFYYKYTMYLKNLLDLDFSNTQIDVIDGAAGLSIILSNIYLKEKDSLVLELMKKCGEKLYLELSKSSKDYLTGFSHGYSGFSSSLFALGYHLNEEKYYNLAKQLINKENKYIDIKRGNWMDLRDNNKESDPVYWCHGASGIALSRMISKAFLKEIDKGILNNDIELGVSKILTDGFTLNLNHSLCHGSFGNIDCLLSIAQNTHNEELMEKVYKLADIECTKIAEYGIACANPLKVETVNFMLGISGVGYELLRLHDNSIPSVLALEVF